MARGFNTTLGTGSTDNLVTTVNVALASSWSVSVKLNRRASTTNARVYQLQTGNQSILLFDNTNTWWQINRGTSGTSGVWKMTAGTSTGTEYHIVITQSATSAPVVYLDGVSQTVTQITGPTGTEDTAANTLTIGNIPGSGRIWDGTIGELAFWSAVLTADEAASLKVVSPMMVRPSKLQNYWPMFGNQSPETDWVGSSSLTVTGAKVQPHYRTEYPSMSRIILPASAAPPAGKLFITSTLNGLGAGGPFFHNRLG